MGMQRRWWIGRGLWLAGFLGSAVFFWLAAAAEPAPDPVPVIGEAAAAEEAGPAARNPVRGEAAGRADLEAASGFVYLPLIGRPPLANMTPFEAEVVSLANIERAKAGCSPLDPNPALREAAFLHSKDMGDFGYFSHTGRDGSSFVTRAQRAGYTGSPRGENIAAGYSSPASVMAAWMNSSGHRANILNCSSNEIGVGYYRAGKGYVHYWTQVFGRK